MASACINHCKQVCKVHNISRPMDTFNLDKILDNILCTFCANDVELLVAILNIREQCTNNPTIKLIVIDSFSYLFRMIEDPYEKIYVLSKALVDLQKIASEFGCAVRFIGFFDNLFERF